MKLIFLSVLLLIGCSPFFTQSYNWVNDQYDAGDWGDYGGVLYSNSVEGKVKQIESYIPCDGDSLCITSITKYAESGQIIEYIAGHYLQMKFEYMESVDCVIIGQRYLADSDSSMEYETSLITESILFPGKPDSIRYNQNGQVTMYAHNKDVTYTTYDDQGRKLTDSVPAGMSGEHSINWKYEEGKVIEEVHLFVDEETEKFEYILDSNGNWMRQNRIMDDGSIQLQLLRWITYY